MLSKKAIRQVALVWGAAFRLFGRASEPDRRTPRPTCKASYAIDAHTPPVGGPSRRSDIVLRFCTIAARWNSSRALLRPRRRIRSKPCWTFRCAKRISTFLRALLDRSNSGVPFSERAWLRASSLTSRAIFLNGARVHRCLSVQARQSCGCDR